MTRRQDWPLISGLALGLIALIEAAIYVADGNDRAISMLLALSSTLPLIARRTHLTAAAAVISLSTLVLLASDAPTPETIAGIVAQVWVLYLLAERSRGRVAIALGVVLAIAAIGDGDPGISNLVLLVGGIGALAVGNSRRLGEEVIDARAEQAALEERARIARELHDVVAHHVSTIAIQADTARLTTPGMPPEGGERLEAIGQTAREAMTEMRRVLGVLRTGDGEELEPQPGLDRLGELLETARAAGTPVRLVLEGDAEPLPPGVELTAYRIVQEALTNVRKHAPGASADVQLRFAAGALVVRVRDDGPGPGGGSGQGLLGMRERIAMVGGELSTGAAPGGGFQVEARLPT